MTEKKITIRLTKKDLEMLQLLCGEYGETMTNIVKHSLHYLYDARNKDELFVKGNEK